MGKTPGLQPAPVLFAAGLQASSQTFVFIPSRCTIYLFTMKNLAVPKSPYSKLRQFQRVAVEGLSNRPA